MGISAAVVTVKKSHLVKQMALLLPALPLPQFMGSASLYTFSIGRNMEVNFYPSRYIGLFIAIVTY